MPVSKHSVRGGKSSKRMAGKPKTAGKLRTILAGKPAALKGTQSAKPKYLVTKFFDSSGLVVVDRVVKRFGMSKQQLAETMGVKPETVYRASRASAPKTQARATEMLEIVGRIAGWAGGEKQAMAWYRAEPIAAFGGRTAEALVKEGKAAAVRDYLDHVATGGFV